MIGWDDPEELDPEIEVVVSAPLKRVGRDSFPRHPRPERLDPVAKAWHKRVWGHGEPVVTPRLAGNLVPGELELYAGSLSRKLRHYAWSRVDAYGTGILDAESLVQDALWARWTDPRELEDQDVERFAINQIRQAAIKMAREFKRRVSGPEDELDPQLFTDRGRMLSADENPYTAEELRARYLSESSWAWIQDVLSKKSAEAVRLVLEEQYTHDEAARAVGLKRLAVTRAFATLRLQVSDLGKDT